MSSIAIISIFIFCTNSHCILQSISALSAVQRNEYLSSSIPKAHKIFIMDSAHLHLLLPLKDNFLEFLQNTISGSCHWGWDTLPDVVALIYVYYFNLFHLGWNSDRHKEHEWILVLEKSLKNPIEYVLFWSRKYPFYFHYII